MTLIELASPSELDAFLKSNDVCLVTFSAHWCGPCRASKPQLEDLAKGSPIPFGYTYESDLGDYLHTFSIKAFPTYVCFKDGKEVDRVVGVNFAGIQEMVSKHATGSNSNMPQSGGNALGGGTSTAALSPDEARKLRLARFGGGGGGGNAASEATKKVEEEKPPAATSEKDDDDDDAKKPAAAEKNSESDVTPMETDNSGPEKKTEGKEGKDDDATMTDVPTEACKPCNPADGLDQEAVKMLTESMGFTLLRAQKGLLYSSGGNVESAVEWLMEHQDDVDIDEPIPDGPVAKAQSYKCNECGKILSNMANLELHANKTGHSDFEESTQAVTPLTPEEKAAKIAEIKELLKAKRNAREEAEKVDHVEREKQRRFMGQEMAKTREQMEKEQRKREALARKREKQEAKRERERIRLELEKDKMERRANNGKLSSKLGVDGYNPDGIQYDKPTDDGATSNDGEPATQKAKKSHGTTSANVGRIDEYIQKVSSYRAGGDGGKCLKILKAYIGNVADHPTEEKYKTINMENKAYKTKIKPFLGAKHLLLAVGFAPVDNDPTRLSLRDDADVNILQETKSKLEQAMIAFG